MNADEKSVLCDLILAVHCHQQAMLPFSFRLGEMEARRQQATEALDTAIQRAVDLMKAE